MLEMRLAIDDIPATAQLSDRLKDYQPGDTIQLTVFHQDELRTYPVTPPTTSQSLPGDTCRASFPTQEQNFAGLVRRATLNPEQ